MSSLDLEQRIKGEWSKLSTNLIREYRESTRELTGEILEELAGESNPFGLKFVRQSDRIVVAPPHRIHIKIAAIREMYQPEDAGLLICQLRNIISVSGDSNSLGITGVVHSERVVTGELVAEIAGPKGLVVRWA